MKLMSTTDFVLIKNNIGIEVQGITHQIKNRADKFEIIFKYATFLKRKLKLGDFIPCHDNGDIFNEPTDMYNSPQYYESEMQAYEIAKNKIIFKGFDAERDNVKIWLESNLYTIVEDLIKHDLELTKTAIEQIYG